MRVAAVSLVILALSVLGGGCSHASAPARSAAPPPPPVAWPAQPEAARVRLLFEISSLRPALPRGWWRSALDWLTGAEHQDRAQRLARPFDVALADDGSILVADPDAAAVVRYAADGRFLSELRCPGYSWTDPMAVATGSEGEIFVADAGTGAVVRWSEAGCGVFRPKGLERPTGVAVHGGRVFVADPPAHRVVVLSRDGELVGSFGERGEGDGQFNFPTDVAAAPDGSVYVVDSLNFRIAHLSAEGRWLGAIGAPGEEGPGLERPKSVDVDGAGAIYVTDAQRDVALVFRPDGTFDYAIGAPGEDPGYLAHPAGIAARHGRVAIADTLNRRVQVFEFTGGAR